VFYNKPNAGFTVQSQFMGGLTFAPATGSGLAYNWTFGDGNSSTAVKPTHTYTTNGNYNVKLVVLNPTSGCSDSSSQSVSVVSVGFADKKANNFQAEVYPNPFRETTQLTYTLTSAEEVSIRVLNLLGQEVMQLPAELKQAGKHQVDFSTANLASGVYYIRLQVGKTQHTLRVVKTN
jgi:PKD repeat protein